MGTCLCLITVFLYLNCCPHQTTFNGLLSRRMQHIYSQSPPPPCTHHGEIQLCVSGRGEANVLSCGTPMCTEATSCAICSENWSDLDHIQVHNEQHSKPVKHFNVTTNLVACSTHSVILIAGLFPRSFVINSGSVKDVFPNPLSWPGLHEFSQW